MNNRLSWIDQARGVALLLVVIGHLGIPYFGQYYTTVHLPLFFFLSGVTFSANRDLVPFLKGRAKRLLIPYVCLGIPLVLSSVVTRIVQGVTDPGAYWQVCVAFLLQRRQYTVWFLTCLFLASVLLWCLIRLLKNRPGRILGVCFGLSAVAVVYWELGGVALPWNLDAGLVALVFMALGYCTRQTGWLEEKKNFRSWPVFGAAALGYLICVTVNGFVFRENFDMATLQVGFAPLTLPGILCGIYCIVFFLKHVSLGPVAEYLGQNTMVYFAWHQSIVLPLLLWVYSLLGWFTADNLVSDVLRTGLTLVLIFALLYPFDLLLRKTKLHFVVGK